MEAARFLSRLDRAPMICWTRRSRWIARQGLRDRTQEALATACRLATARLKQELLQLVNGQRQTFQLRSLAGVLIVLESWGWVREMLCISVRSRLLHRRLLNR